MTLRHLTWLQIRSLSCLFVDDRLCQSLDGAVKEHTGPRIPMLGRYPTLVLRLAAWLDVGGGVVREL